MDNINEKNLDLNSKLSETKSEISLLKEKLEKLEEQEKILEIEINNQTYLDSISLVTRENSLIVKLTKESKTTPIMEKFYHSDKKFLIFQDVFRIYNNSRITYTSLVITKQDVYKRGSYLYNGFVMTDLKKVSGAFLYCNRLDQKSRLFSLFEEIFNSLKKSGNLTKCKFEHICMLGGQTFQNQTDFGSIYNGDYLVDEKLYGETTKFLIIGIVDINYIK